MCRVCDFERTRDHLITSQPVQPLNDKTNVGAMMKNICFMYSFRKGFISSLLQIYLMLVSSVFHWHCCYCLFISCFFFSEPHVNRTGSRFLSDFLSLQSINLLPWYLTEKLKTKGKASRLVIAFSPTICILFLLFEWLDLYFLWFSSPLLLVYRHICNF